MKRVSRACQQCRSKHIKCNGRSPCSRCIAHAELHNISPTEICLYPEPKKRGRPSAGTSAHHSHHSSHTSSSVTKKKLNSTNRVKVISSPSSSVSSITRRQTCSANTSPTPNVINLQQQQQQPQQQLRWQKTSLVAQPESVVYWNASESVQVPSSYGLPQQISLSHPNQMPISMADLVTQNLNFHFISNYDYGYLNQSQQPQPRVITLNAATAPSHSSTALIPQNSMSSNNANTCYRQVYPNNNNNNSSNNNNNSNSNGGRASSNTNNNNSNRDNSYHSPNSHHYHLNRPYHAHLNYSAATSSNGLSQMNANSTSHFSDSSMYSNNSNFSNEGSDSSSDSLDDSSLTSTPELLPTFNTNPPSITNSPVLNLADYNPYMYGVNTNALNIGHVEPLLHDYIAYQQESELDSPLLSDAKSEIAYVSSIAPYSSANCIYPSLLERNNTSTYVKAEDSRSLYESIPVNTAGNGWLY